VPEIYLIQQKKITLCLKWSLYNFFFTVTIEASHKLVKFSASGDIVGGNITLRPRESSEERVEIETESPQYKVQLSFAVRYLNYFSKAAPLASHVQLKLADNLPLEVTFYLNDNTNVGRLRFYLAPKMEEESDSQNITS
jgi:proliferating cell nuclear antigen